MKFSIFNTLKAGIIVLTLASAGYVEAEHKDSSLTIGHSNQLEEQTVEAGIAIIPRRVKEKLRGGRFVTKAVVESINAWQFNAIYLKAGIESLAKATSGDEISVINSNLANNASHINDFVEHYFTHDCDTSSNLETLDLLISAQNALLYDYAVAYTAQNFLLVDALDQELIEINNAIYLFLIEHVYDSNESLDFPDQLQLALAAYLDSLIIEIQAIVIAVNFGKDLFTPTYDAYRNTLEAAQEVGRLIGKAVTHAN